ncbi:MAG TPA: PIG-L family deacetylase [Terriglobales bacterium]|nr:PIG-L family deacetylase [Terriglobales bacterium]
MTHVFVSPHPDDAALSCGGLIARLRDGGEPVTILTVYSGAGSLDRLTPYQRLALGFGSREKWQPSDDAGLSDAGLTDAATPADASASAPGGANLADAAPANAGEGPGAAPTPEQVMAVRRAEDESFARFVGASVVFLNLPDAVFRGYEGDAELLGEPRPDDPAPVEELRAALAGLAPDALYLPFAIGGHVDHRGTRRAAMALLAEPGSPYLDRARFYEDFPYALTTGFERPEQLDPEIPASLPAGVALTPEYVEMADLLDRRLAGLRAYESQLGRLFGGDSPMASDVRGRATRVGELGGIGPSERYWRVTNY